MRTYRNIFWLGTKELRSFLRDFVLLALVIYAFSLAVISQAQSNSQEVHNASIAIVDEDHSELSRRIAHAFLPPYFKPPQPIAERDIVPLMNLGKYTFVVDIPPNFERDVLGGRKPGGPAQCRCDRDGAGRPRVGLHPADHHDRDQRFSLPCRGHAAVAGQSRRAHRVQSQYDDGVVHQRHGHHQQRHHAGDYSAGRAVIREREHGTMDHLLVMPVTPFEIAMSKVWANGLVITVAVGLSLYVVVRADARHSHRRVGAAVYARRDDLSVLCDCAIGIFLGTVARSMPQLGLLYILVYLPMTLLSGSNTPLESMPPWLRTVMQASPSTHFVSFAQAILFRGAGIDVVWPRFLFVAVVGGLFLMLALLRFRSTTAAQAM